MPNICDKAIFCEMFDSFCKTMLRNAMRDYLRHLRHQYRAERLVDDPVMFAGREDSITDTYNIDQLYVSYKNRQYVMDNETLCNAMRHLPERQLGVFILGYWLRWKDKQIAQAFGVTDRTIRNLRRRAFQEIRRWFSETVE